MLRCRLRDQRGPHPAGRPLRALRHWTDLAAGTTELLRSGQLPAALSRSTEGLALFRGEALVDAYLWVKIPGESDGECTRGLGPAGETVDPEWGIVDPGAGEWFPQQALQLAANAEPPLRRR